MSQRAQPPPPGQLFLTRIVDATRERVARLRAERTFDSLLGDAQLHQRRPFADALRTNPPSIIAEIKKASPSKGVLRPDFDHLSLARAYEQGGAAAFSIVTEPQFFLGEDRWLEQIRSMTKTPILRKDFILDPLQVAESAALGADSILLIARLLSVAQMRELADAAAHCSLDVLFEAHDAEELAKIASCVPQLVGINARDLDTLVVDTCQFETLGKLVPISALKIAESGLDSADAIRSAGRLGYSAFLIGEALVRSDNPAATIAAFRMT